LSTCEISSSSDTADVNVTDVSSSVYTPIGLAAAYKTGYFGTALTICDDAVEQNIVQGPNEFDSITPENAMN